MVCVVIRANFAALLAAGVHVRADNWYFWRACLFIIAYHPLHCLVRVHAPVPINSHTTIQPF